MFDVGTEDDACYLEIQRLRARGQTWKDTTFTSFNADRVKHIWDILQSGFARGYWDFMYLLEESDRRGLTFRADYVAVDEINDLTPLQCRIVGRSEGTKVVFCGDLNQTIFGWSGVDPETILTLPHDTTENQNESYRLTTEVAVFADKIIDRASKRYGEKIIPLAGSGEVLRDKSFRNVLYKLPVWGNAMVLGRTNYIVDQARRVALDAGANVVLSDAEVLQGELCKLIADRPPTFPLEKVEAVLGSWLPSGRFWKHGAKKKLRECTSRYMQWDVLYEEYGTPDLRRVMEGELDWYEGRPAFNPDEPVIRFSTTHAAKGLEEENVVVLRDMSARVRNGLEQNEDEEVRIAYVAATRAKKRLVVSQLDLAGGGNPYLGG